MILYHISAKKLITRCTFSMLAASLILCPAVFSGCSAKTENVKKRKPDAAVISLDAEQEKTESKYDSVTGTESAENTVVEMEMYQYMLHSLTEKQRKIVKAKLSGYSNQEILVLLNIPSSSFYKEMQKIKATIGKIIG